MANLRIPQGKDYKFFVTVLEKDSYLPKDLTNMDTVNSYFELVALSSLIRVFGSSTIARIPDKKINVNDPDTFLNGRLSVMIPSTISSNLDYERGEKVDGYYLKPTYQGLLSVQFTDGTAEIISIIPDVYIVPTGA